MSNDDISAKADNVRQEIFQAVQEIDDAQSRAVLLLLHKALDVIIQKIDTVLDDELAIKKLVLNGITEGHEDDHLWLREHRKSSCDEVCTWAKKKMAEELLDNQDTRDIRKGLKQNVIWAVISAGTTLILIGLGVIVARALGI